MAHKFALQPLAAVACLFGIIALLMAAPAAAQDVQSSPHVRSDDPRLRLLIRKGMEQSKTFRELVSEIDRLPGLVYIVSSRCGAGLTVPACLDHNVRTRGGYRFLRVNVAPNESGARLLALIAHELQHALEVLSDESATTQEGVTQLYERIASKRSRSRGFETERALAVQETVRRELRQQPAQ